MQSHLRQQRLLTVKLLLFGALTLSSCYKDNTKSSEMTFTPGDSAVQTLLQTNGGNVSGLHLLIRGEIKGLGQLSFGDSDSTYYKTYELKEGQIEIEYDGDWYSRFCYVTYQPTSETEGQLKIEGNFIVD